MRTIPTLAATRRWPSRWLIVIMLLALTALLLGVKDAAAHSLGQSYLYLGISEQRVAARVEITIADLNEALGLDLPTDKTVTVPDLKRHAERINAYVLSKVRLAPNGVPTQLSIVDHRLLNIKLAQFALIDMVTEPLDQPPQTIDIEYEVMFEVNEDHAGIQVIENDWKSGTFENEAGIALTFTASKRAQTLDLSTSTLWRGLRGMIRLGMHHIMVGADHIMFLIVLLLPSVARREQGRWQEVSSFRDALIYVVKIVTLFTIAHSITLSLTMLETINLPPRLVESMIAISIALAAIDIFYPVFGRKIGWVVFLFGLFHGAGFADVLLEMNIHDDYVTWTLFGFNVGVELGQLTVVCVIFPLLFLIRAQPAYLRFGMHSVAGVLAMISVYWFIERAFDVDLPAGEYAQILIGKVF